MTTWRDDSRTSWSPAYDKIVSHFHSVNFLPPPPPSTNTSFRALCSCPQRRLPAPPGTRLTEGRIASTSPFPASRPDLPIIAQEAIEAPPVSSMNATRVLRQAAVAQHRTPLIHFLGKRSIPGMCPVHHAPRAGKLIRLSESVDHAPHAHPASPSPTLPDSFVTYRSKAQQHGPLTHRPSFSTSTGFIGGHSGKSLGSVEPPRSQFFDRSELPSRFHGVPWTQAEIDAIETGGASLFA